MNENTGYESIVPLHAIRYDDVCAQSIAEICEEICELAEQPQATVIMFRFIATMAGLGSTVWS